MLALGTFLTYTLYINWSLNCVLCFDLVNLMSICLIYLNLCVTFFYPLVCMVQHPNQLYKVYRAKWFMALYGGLTPKPQYAYCNSCHIAKLNLGRMVGWLKSKSANGKRVATCKTYLNSKGDKCFKGTPALRKSEYLAGKLFTVYFFNFRISEFGFNFQTQLL